MSDTTDDRTPVVQLRDSLRRIADQSMQDVTTFAEECADLLACEDCDLGDLWTMTPVPGVQDGIIVTVNGRRFRVKITDIESDHANREQILRDALSGEA